MKWAVAAILVLPSVSTAGVSLRWAPALNSALSDSKIELYLDDSAGLAVDARSLDALEKIGVKQLADLQTLFARPAAGAALAKTGLDLERAQRLRRSLETISPLIARLEADNLTAAEFSRSKARAVLLDHALQAETRAANAKAERILIALDTQQLSLDDLERLRAEAKRLMRTEHAFLSGTSLDRLAKVQEPLRGRIAMVRKAQRNLAFAVSAADTRDAPADTPKKNWLRRCAEYLGAFLP